MEAFCLARRAGTEEREALAAPAVEAARAATVAMAVTVTRVGTVATGATALTGVAEEPVVQAGAEDLFTCTMTRTLTSGLSLMTSAAVLVVPAARVGSVVSEAQPVLAEKGLTAGYGMIRPGMMGQMALRGQTVPPESLVP